MEIRYMYEYDGVETQYFLFDFVYGCFVYMWIPVKEDSFSLDR
jgi:hypothetical protein